MKRQQIRPRRASEPPTPRDEFDAADVHAMTVFSQLCDNLVDGCAAGRAMTLRAALGRDGAQRAALISSFQSAPRPSDWERMARTSQRDAVVAYYRAEAERTAGIPAADVDVTHIALMRESTEADIATMEAGRDPSKLPHAINENLDRVNAAAAHARALMRANFTFTQMRTHARRALGLTGGSAA